MYARIATLCAVTLLSSCAEILRQPDVDPQSVNFVKADVNYNVTAFDVSPEVIKEANASQFIRLVNLGGNHSGPVRRVEEASLFNNSRAVAGKRPAYQLGVGDAVDVTRAGFVDTLTGAQNRQTVTTTHLVSERGAIDLSEAGPIFVEGLSVEQSVNAIKAALTPPVQRDQDAIELRDFPKTKPGPYRLGVGDVVKVSRIINKTNSDGILDQSINVSKNIVGPDGLVSILQLGEVEVGGLTLSQVRSKVVQQAIRNAVGSDLVVEIDSFSSQSALITGELGTFVVPLTDQSLSYDRMFARFETPLSGDRDFLLRLERNGETYLMTARSLFEAHKRDSFFALDGDRLSIEPYFSGPNVRVAVSQFASRTISYVRITGNEPGAPPITSASRTVPLDIRGLSLRDLLVNQNINIGSNKDLLVRLNRGNREYRISARSVVLDNSNRQYWLQAGDHVIVEDIAYIGDDALLVGELRAPSRLLIDRYQRTTLSEALFAGELFSTGDADFRHVYVFRGKDLTFNAYHFDITQVLNLSLAEQFEMRPGDIVFVRTRPLSRYNRALSLALGLGARLEALNELRQ